jgi:lysine N6-hydroxylase
MERLHFIGIGAGPSNLSLAALAAPITSLRGKFLDAKPHFQWHAGAMLPGSLVQVSYLKDLVTLVDPTSRYSFLNFLVREGRIYRAIVANKAGCSRHEFEQYFRWVARQLPTIRWSERVKTVSISNGYFKVTCESGFQAAATSLVIGTGRVPALPDFAAAYEDNRQVLHSSEMLNASPDFQGKRVLVVGAGQSGAEIVDFLLSQDETLPSSITWISSRAGFLPIDDSAFSNEWFAAPYIDYFYSLSVERRSSLLQQQRLASDGISESLIQRIYTRLYQLDISGNRSLHHRLLPCRRMTGLRKNQRQLIATLHNLDRDCIEQCDTDIVIFCSGYRTVFPTFMESLRDRMVDASGALQIRPDYSIAWNGPDKLRVYILNGAERTHGIADPNLSLISWRSSRVLNAIAGREIYPASPATTTTAWNNDVLFQNNLSVADQR